MADEDPWKDFKVGVESDVTANASVDDDPWAGFHDDGPTQPIDIEPADVPDTATRKSAKVSVMDFLQMLPAATYNGLQALQQGVAPPPMEVDIPFPTNFDEFKSNAGKDAENNLRGLGVLSTIAAQRAYETFLPGRFLEPQLADKPGADKFGSQAWQQANLPGITGIKTKVPLSVIPGMQDVQFDLGANPRYPMVRHSDGPQAALLGANIAKHYYDKFVAPALDLDPTKTLEYAGKQPLSFAMDVVPVAGPLAKAVGGARKATAAVNPFLAPGRGTMGMDVAQFGKPVKESAMAASRAMNAIRESEREYDWKVQNTPELATPATPPEWLGRAEMPELKNIQKPGDPVEQALMGWRKHARNLKDSQPDAAKAAELRDYLRKSGFDTDQQIDDAASALARRLKDPLNEIGDPVLKKQAPMVDPEATMVQQIYQSHVCHLYDHLREIMAQGNTLAQSSTKDTRMTPFAVRSYMGAVMKRAGMKDEAINEFVKQLPGSIELPKSVAEALDPFKRAEAIDLPIPGLGKLHEADFIPDAIKRFLPSPDARVSVDPVNAAVKELSLGYNLPWVAGQAVGGAYMANKTMFRSARDLSASIMAYILTFDKSARKILKRDQVISDLPNSWFDGMNQDFKGGKKLFGLLQDNPITRTMLGTAGDIDNTTRSVVGHYFIMRKAEELHPELRLQGMDAFNPVKRIEQYEKALGHKDVREAALKELNAVTGDYSQLAARDVPKWVQVVDPFYKWHFAHALPNMVYSWMKNPIKSSLEMAAGREAAPMFQDANVLNEDEMKRGKIALKSPEGKQLLDPFHGRPLVQGKPGFLPSLQGPNMAKDIVMVGAGQPGKVESFGLGPLVSNIAGRIYGFNPGTGDDYRMSALAGGKFHRVTGEEVKDPMPPVEDSIANSSMGKLAGDARKAWTAPYLPADDSSAFPWNDRRAYTSKSKFPDGLISPNYAQPLWLQFAINQLGAEPQVQKTTKAEADLQKLFKEAEKMKTLAKDQGKDFGNPLREALEFYGLGGKKK